jgi:membrane protease subunit HflK
MQDVLRNTGKVLLDVKEGSNLTYLPLDRMIQPSTREKEFQAPDSPRIALPPTGGDRPGTSFDSRRGSDRSRRER